MTGRYHFDGCAFAGKSFAVLQKCGTVRGAEIDPQEKEKTGLVILVRRLGKSGQVKDAESFWSVLCLFLFHSKIHLMK